MNVVKWGSSWLVGQTVRSTRENNVAAIGASSERSECEVGGRVQDNCRVWAPST